jgi:hypothetical protein
VAIDRPNAAAGHPTADPTRRSDQQNIAVIWSVVDHVRAYGQRADPGSELRPVATKAGKGREKHELLEECVYEAIAKADSR